MDTIASTKFRCTRCGHTAFRAYIPISHDQVDMFLAGEA